MFCFSENPQSTKGANTKIEQKSGGTYWSQLNITSRRTKTSSRTGRQRGGQARVPSRTTSRPCCTASSRSSSADATDSGCTTVAASAGQAPPPCEGTRKMSDGGVFHHTPHTSHPPPRQSLPSPGHARTRAHTNARAHTLSLRSLACHRSIKTRAVIFKPPLWFQNRLFGQIPNANLFSV